MKAPQSLFIINFFYNSSDTTPIKALRHELFRVGKNACVLSSDGGRTWNVSVTPILQGLVLTGIFTADSYNEKINFAAGGNYDNPKQNFGNKIRTENGGKTLNLIAENQGFGYSCCVL